MIIKMTQKNVKISIQPHPTPPKTANTFKQLNKLNKYLASIHLHS